MLEKQIIFLKITFNRVEIINLINQTERQWNKIKNKTFHAIKDIHWTYI